MAYLDLGYSCVQCGCFLKIDRRETRKQGQLVLRCPVCGIGNQFECLECGYPTVEWLSKDGLCEICSGAFDAANIQKETIFIGGQEN